MFLKYVQYGLYFLHIVDSGTLLTFCAEGHGTLKAQNQRGTLKK